MSHVILDGMLIESDRLAGSRDNGNDLWFSQKRKTSAATSSSCPAPDGTPLWVSDVEPGSTPDITAARLHVLPALYKAAADGLPTWPTTGASAPASASASRSAARRGSRSKPSTPTPAHELPGQKAPHPR
jgi:hypothetical protein